MHVPEHFYMVLGVASVVLAVLALFLVSRR